MDLNSDGSISRYEEIMGQIGVVGLGMSALSSEGAKVAGTITGYTRHGLNQAISRPGGGVSARAILDAVRNPTQMIQQGKGVVKYVGEKATVIINRAGKIISTWGQPRVTP